MHRRRRERVRASAHGRERPILRLFASWVHVEVTPTTGTNEHGQQCGGAGCRPVGSKVEECRRRLARYGMPVVRRGGGRGDHHG